MAYKEPAFTPPGISIKFKETFSMADLYEMLRQTLIEEGWTNRSNSEKEEFMEKFYMERVDPGAGKECWIYWRVFRKVNGFIKETLNIDYHILTMKNVEIVNKGQKLNVQKGEVEVFFSSDLIADYNDTWEKSKFWSSILGVFAKKDKYKGGFLEFFIKRFYSNQWETMKNDLRKDIYRIHSRVKNFLDLKDWLKTETPFQASLPGSV